jgi:cobalamin synthase
MKKQIVPTRNARRITYGFVCAVLALLIFSIFSVELEPMAQIYLLCASFGLVSMGMIVLGVINPQFAAFWAKGQVERRDIFKVYAVLALVFFATAIIIQPTSIQQLHDQPIELKQK